MYEGIKQIIFYSALLLSCAAHAQNIGTRLQQAFAEFENDPQLKNAIASLYVVDAQSGATVFEKNSRVGLAPASTQKIITAATAYALLGKSYRYKTEFGYMGTIQGEILNGAFYLSPSFDPTLGSWRWNATKDTALFQQWLNRITQLKITRYADVKILDSGWQQERVPNGWIWEDIGNYYGAGVGAFNWHENQFDVVLKSGVAIESKAEIVNQKPDYNIPLKSYVLAAEKGSGDNAWVYYPQLSAYGVIRGTIPVNENAFTISAALPDPSSVFKSWLTKQLTEKAKIRQFQSGVFSTMKTPLYVHFSPALDSICFWLLKKSINLYGEALLKTLSYEKDKKGTVQSGINITKDFWKNQNIVPTELAIVDGSGLSPLNRVTTHAQVEVLRYAKKQDWFSGYFDGFPVYNDMKMKSGTIAGAKGFCGYHKSKNGKEYIFSFLVNNYNGASSAVVGKMYKVLDLLK